MTAQSVPRAAPSADPLSALPMSRLKALAELRIDEMDSRTALYTLIELQRQADKGEGALRDALILLVNKGAL